MKALYKKELNYYLNNPVGYIVIILFSVFANFLFVKDIFAVGSASMKSFFNIIPWLMLIFIPAISMRSISEEKRSNTIEVLLTMPISETEIVLAKFLSLATLTGTGLTLTLALPVSLAFMSNLHMPEIAVGYLGLLLVGSAFAAVSVFFSSLTKNQVVAFLFSVIALFFILVMGGEFTASVLPKFLTDTLSIFTPMYHLQNFIKGLVDIRSIFYFAGMTSVFLFLTVTSLERRD